MTNEQIKEIALANGFKLKEQPNGEMDLNPYVYDFARALMVGSLQNIKASVTHHKPSDYHGYVWLIGSEINKIERGE